MPRPKLRLNLFGKKTGTKYHTHGPEKGIEMHKEDHRLRDVIANHLRDGRNRGISNLELKKNLQNARTKHEDIHNVTDYPLRHSAKRWMRLLKRKD